jgi:hypothetical protein
MQVLCQSRLCRADHVYLKYLMLQRRLSHLLSIEIVYKDSVRTSQETYYVSDTKPKWLMLLREIVAVCCKNHTEHTNTRCGQNAEF